MNADQAWAVEWINRHVYPMMKVSDRMDVRRINAKLEGAAIRIDMTFNNGYTVSIRTDSTDEKKLLQMILDAV